MENESTLLIDMTETATSKIKEVLKEQELNNSYLRIQMTSNEHGAPGYAFGLEENPSQDDTVVDLGDFKALIDPGTLPLISGSNIDYVEGLHRSGFIITNFGVWTSGMYGYTITGLYTCFILAIPFFAYSLISTLFFSIIIEVIHSLLKVKLRIFKQ